MRRLLSLFGFFLFGMAPLVASAIETPDITIYPDSIFQENHSSIKWTTSVKGDCSIYFSREQSFELLTQTRGRVVSSIENEYTYMANLNEGSAPIQSELVYYYYVGCNFPDSGEKIVKSSLIRKVSQRIWDEINNPPIMTFDTLMQDEANDRLVFKWSTNVNATCDATFSLSEDSARSWGELFPVRSIKTKISSGKYTYEVIVPSALSYKNVQFSAACQYGDRTLTIDKKSLEIKNPNAPKIIVDSLVQDQNSNKILFKWFTNVDATCDALVSVDSKMSSTPATKTKISDSKYVHEFFDVVTLTGTEYYFKASCFSGITKLSTDWNRLEINKPQTPTITFDSLRHDQGNNRLVFKWSANVDATCESSFWSSDDPARSWGYSSLNDATKKKNSETGYLYETIVPNAKFYRHVQFMATCNYGGKILVTDKKVLEVNKPPAPVITFDSLTHDQPNNRVTLKWFTNVDVACFSLYSTAIAPSTMFDPPSLMDATKTKISDMKYQHEAIIKDVKSFTRVQMSATCGYGDVKLTTENKSVEIKNTPPASPLLTVNIDAPALDVGGEIAIFKWRTNIDASCEAFLREVVGTSVGQATSGGSAKGKKITDISYEHEKKFALLPIYETVEMRAVCTHEAKTISTDWSRMHISNKAVPPIPQVVYFDSLTQLDSQTISFKWTTNVDADCKGYYSLKSDYSGATTMNVSRKKISDPKYSYESKLTVMPNYSDYYFMASCTYGKDKMESGWKKITIKSATPTQKYDKPKSDPKEVQSTRAEDAKPVNVVVKEVDATGESLAVRPFGERIHNDEIREKANKLVDERTEKLLKELNILRNQLKEQEAEVKYLRKLVKEGQKLTEKMENALTRFIAYGADEKTKGQGEGQRSSVLSSFTEVYGRLPENDVELGDVILLTRGEAPISRNYEAEKLAHEEFIKIYKRIPDFEDMHDTNALNIMTYGMLNGGSRDLQSEKNAQNSFNNIYKKLPVTTDDWNLLRAITYSGAARKADADKDLLPDYLEKQIGTDPNVVDSDKDGFPDGREYLSGYNPLGVGRW